MLDHLKALLDAARETDTRLDDVFCESARQQLGLDDDEFNDVLRKALAYNNRRLEEQQRTKEVLEARLHRMQQHRGGLLDWICDLIL